MRHWSERYVGIPYSEHDCAQLCVKVQSEQFNNIINIPIKRPNGLRGVSDMISDLQDDFAYSVLKPEEGDAVLMIGRGRLNHIGTACYINNQLHILHAMRNAGITVLHNNIALASVGLKIEGYYRWK